MSDPLLRARWHSLCSRVGRADSQAPAAATFDALVAAHSHPARAYHNLDHIAHCLAEFDLLAPLASDPDAVQTAIWFHDFIYDPRAGDNERRSAAASSRFLDSLGADADFRRRVETLILLTRHDAPPETSDGRIVIDADLAILGQPPARFDAYETAIRDEYSFVDDTAFRAGRAGILQNFLDRPRIYLTPPMFARYESQARQNLSRSLLRLKE